MGLLLQLLANGVVNGALFALLAVGFGLVYRTLRVFHISYAGIYVAAAYALFTFNNILKISLPISILLAIASTCIIGYLIEFGIYRPFFKRNASSGVILIASLGVFIVIENLIALFFGNEVKLISTGIEPSYKFAGILLTRIQIIELIAGLLLIVAFYLLVSKTKFFKMIWAMGDEPHLIPVMGLPLYFLRSTVIIISSFFSASASILSAIDVGMDPHMGMTAFLTATVAVIVGGTDRYWGWILGAFVLSIAESLAVWKMSARWVDLIAFSLLILILLTRPQGLLGTRKRLEET